MFPWLLVDPFLYQASALVIVACVVIIVACLVVYFKFLRTNEEKTATQILSHLESMRAGKWSSVDKVSSKTKEEPLVSKNLFDKHKPLDATAPKKSFEIKNDELTLKQMLVSKFKPLIEKQLKMKVELKDFNAKGDNFLALTEISGSKFLFVLDSSGKIVDYKRVK